MTTAILKTRKTDRPVTVMVAGQPVTGRVWQIEPIMPCTADTSPEAQAFRARNRGKIAEIAVFQGVPYCLPAVGPRRLKPAAMAAPTAAVDASRPGPVPPQGYSQEGSDQGRGRNDKGTARGLSAWSDLGTREAELGCQNITITTPDPTAGAGLPVLCRIHGGGSNYLSNADDRGSLDRLAGYGLVCVNIGYRLGNLGHHYLPGHEAEPDWAGANLSLSDIRVALEFVASLIGGFGGDPALVTLIGGSAGGNAILSMAANRDFDDLYLRFVADSPSGGTDPRVAFAPVAGQKTLVEWAADRQRVIMTAAGTLRDVQNPLRPLSAAIAEHGYAKAVREHMSLRDFLAVAEGRFGPSVLTNGQTIDGYTPTQALSLTNDGVTVSHESNRAAARAGAFPAKEAMIGVATFEASVLGAAALSGNPWFFSTQLHHVANGLTTHQFAQSAVYETEWDGSTASPAWASTDLSRARLPWGAATEPNAMIFNAGYWHAAYCVLRAIEEAGGTAYGYVWGYRPEGKASTNRAGHTDAEPAWYANPQWLDDPPGAGNEEQITAQDLYLVDGMAQRLANFCKHGNPNTPYLHPANFQLFAAPMADAMTPFDPISKNWNVIGSPGRFATATPASITNTPGWWSHLMDFLDLRVWGAP